jgi:hypothetical protein
VDKRDADIQTLTRYQTQYRELTSRMAQIGFIWQGSVTSRWLTCGRPDCECARDQKSRHGPYLYWTTKVKGRSVAKLLHSPESEILSEWIGNRRKVEKILENMRKISQKAFKIAHRLRMGEMEREKLR